MRAGTLVAACLALAALTLLAPSAPSYDPFAWIVWGRELMPGGAEPFVLAGGPSWKPLPVLLTAPLSLAGAAAPALWLVVARAGLLLALAGAYALGARLAGRAAGLLAAALVLALDGVVSLAWRGASEPLLLACVLWAVERHLAGARRAALVLGVGAALIRPEAAVFLALYAAAAWRGLDARARAELACAVALVPLLWIGVPALAGDPLAASGTAQTDLGRQASPLTALVRGLGLPVAGAWLLALAAVALRPRDRRLATLLLGALGWIALVVAMTAAGYSGVARYMLPAAAVASLLAAVATVELLRRVRARRPAAALAAVALLLGAGLLAERGATLDEQVAAGVAVAHAHEELRAAVADAGGAAALRRCALHGWLSVNHTTQSALAWELAVPLDRIARTASRPGLVVRAPRGAATGRPPRVTLPRPLLVAERGRGGRWRVLGVRTVGTRLPPACAWKASGTPRRIPNV